MRRPLYINLWLHFHTTANLPYNQPLNFLMILHRTIKKEISGTFFGSFRRSSTPPQSVTSAPQLCSKAVTQENRRVEEHKSTRARAQESRPWHARAPTKEASTPTRDRGSVGRDTQPDRRPGRPSAGALPRLRTQHDPAQLLLSEVDGARERPVGGRAVTDYRLA